MGVCACFDCGCDDTLDCEFGCHCKECGCCQCDRCMTYIAADIGLDRHETN